MVSTTVPVGCAVAVSTGVAVATTMAVCVEVGRGAGVGVDAGALPQSSPHAARSSAATTATIGTRYARMQDGDILMPERRVPHPAPGRQRGRQQLLDHALADPRSDREPVSRYAG